MRRSFIKFLPAAVVVGAILCAVPAAADGAKQRFPIGEHGCSIQLGPAWQRVKLQANLGNDQFVNRGVALVLFEQTALAVDEKGLHAALDAICDSMASSVASSAYVGYAQRNGRSLCQQRLDAVESRVKVSYLISVVHYRTLTVNFLAWAPSSMFPVLKGVVDEAIDSLAADESDAAWVSLNRLVREQAFTDSSMVELGFNPAFWERRPYEEKTLLSLAAGEGDGSCAVFLHSAARDLGEAAKANLAALQAMADPVKDIRQTTIQAQGKPWPALVGRAGEGRGQTVVSVAVAADSRHSLELRLTYPVDEPTAIALARDFLETIAVSYGSDFQAFPEAKAETSDLGEAALALIAAAELEVASPWAVRSGYRTDDGGLVLLAGKRIDSWKHGAPANLFTFADDNFYGTMAPAGDGVALAEAGKPGRLVRAAAGADADWSATLVAGVDGKAFVSVGRVDGSAGRVVPGQRSELWLRPAKGPAKLLDRFDGPVGAVAADRSGRVLVAWRASWQDDNGSPETLEICAGAGKARIDCGAWTAVDTLAGNGAGWLAMGKPLREAYGIYAVGPDGARRLVVSGKDFSLIAGDGERLWFATRRDPDGGQTVWGKSWVYSLPLERAARLGADLQPWHAGMLNDLGAGREFPNLPDAAAVDGLFDLLDGQAFDRCKRHLPRQAAEIDAIFDDYHMANEIDAPGMRVLTLVLARYLIHDGALWVPAGGGSPDARAAVGEESRFARNVNLDEVVRSALFDDEGWYRPASSLSRGSDGRPRLVGLDSAALRTWTRDRYASGFAQALATADPQRLAAWLAERGQRENRPLVRAAVEYWLDRGKTAAAETLLAGLADKQACLATLYRAVMALAGGKTPGPDLAALKAAIAELPGEGVLYLALGDAYRGRGQPGDRDRALRCYLQVDKASTASDWVKERADRAAKDINADRASETGALPGAGA